MLRLEQAIWEEPSEIHPKEERVNVNVNEIPGDNQDGRKTPSKEFDSGQDKGQIKKEKLSVVKRR